MGSDDRACLYSLCIYGLEAVNTDQMILEMAMCCKLGMGVSLCEVPVCITKTREQKYPEVLTAHL